MFELEDWESPHGGKEEHLMHSLFGDVSSTINEGPSGTKKRKKRRKHRGDTENLKKAKRVKLGTKEQSKLNDNSGQSPISCLNAVGIESLQTEKSDDAEDIDNVNKEMEEENGDAIPLSAIGKSKKKRKHKQTKTMQSDEIGPQNNSKNGQELLNEEAVQHDKTKKKDLQENSPVLLDIETGLENPRDKRKNKKKKKKRNLLEASDKKLSNESKVITKLSSLNETDRETQRSGNSDSDHNSNENSLTKTQPPRKPNLQDKMKRKLESSRFRWINEKLYTTSGDDALGMFSEEPALFDVYHRGFRAQVEHWPVNPVDVIIQWVKERSPSLVLADFGCGDAVIAQTVPNKVHSFDLVAKNDQVIPCNMAQVPLESDSVDVAIFCLSLMGTDLPDYLKEAHRVLRKGGILKIAEVVSRLDVEAFVHSLEQLGFQLNSKDDSNKMFILLDFTKGKQKKKSNLSDLSGLQLKPCIYKKR